MRSLRSQHSRRCMIVAAEARLVALMTAVACGRLCRLEVAVCQQLLLPAGRLGSLCSAEGRCNRAGGPHRDVGDLHGAGGVARLRGWPALPPRLTAGGYVALPLQQLLGQVFVGDPADLALFPDLGKRGLCRVAVLRGGSTQLIFRRGMRQHPVLKWRGPWRRAGSATISAGCRASQAWLVPGICPMVAGAAWLRPAFARRQPPIGCTPCPRSCRRAPHT